ncbi:hypothetical protein V8F20_009996 [Naviculisporaceae sp. PSN 640]
MKLSILSTAILTGLASVVTAQSCTTPSGIGFCADRNRIPCAKMGVIVLGAPISSAALVPERYDGMLTAGTEDLDAWERESVRILPRINVAFLLSEKP